MNADPEGAPPDDDGWPRSVIASWTLIFGANLLIPWPLALCALRDGGLIGFHLALSLIWLTGCGLRLRLPRLGDALESGAAVVAFLQFLPLAHIVCLATASALWRGFANLLDAPLTALWLMQELGGFVITLVTAGELALMGLLIGVGLTSPSVPSHVTD